MSLRYSRKNRLNARKEVLNFGEIITKGEYFLGVSPGRKLGREVPRDVFSIEFSVVIIDLSKSNCVFHISDISEKDVNTSTERQLSRFLNNCFKYIHWKRKSVCAVQN